MERAGRATPRRTELGREIAENDAQDGLLDHPDHGERPTVARPLDARLRGLFASTLPSLGALAGVLVAATAHFLFARSALFFAKSFSRLSFRRFFSASLRASVLAFFRIRLAARSSISARARICITVVKRRRRR